MPDFYNNRHLRLPGGKPVPDFAREIPFKTLAHLHRATNPADEMENKKIKALLSRIFSEGKVKFPRSECSSQ